jgi:hypothetical protein
MELAAQVEPVLSGQVAVDHRDRGSEGDDLSERCRCRLGRTDNHETGRFVDQSNERVENWPVVINDIHRNGTTLALGRPVQVVAEVVHFRGIAVAAADGAEAKVRNIRAIVARVSEGLLAIGIRTIESG